jgi:hypothetical protein
MKYKEIMMSKYLCEFHPFRVAFVRFETINDVIYLMNNLGKEHKYYFIP